MNVKCDVKLEADEELIRDSRLLNLAFLTLIELDLNRIRKHINKWNVKWDKEDECWRINGDYIEDWFWYEATTYIHPKEITPYVIKIIEDELKINKGD